MDSRAENLQQLLRDARLWRGDRQAPLRAWPTGYGALDALLPGGGWPCANLSEIVYAQCGVGELRLATPLLARLTQQQRPVPRVKPEIPHYIVTAGVLHANLMEATSPVLIARRPADGLLGGMWEFPGGKQQPGETLEDCLIRELREELGVAAEITGQLGSYRHAYTHFRVTLHAFHCRITSGEPQPLSADQLAWVIPSQLGSYPMGKLDRLISRDLNR